MISEQYAAELSRQIDELELENEQLRAEVERLKAALARYDELRMGTLRGFTQTT